MFNKVIIVAFIFWIPAIGLAKKYPNDFGAKASNIIISLLIFLFIITSIIGVLMYLIG
ncbi:hypothetical protein [Paenibacillus sp. GSMTC-2017]|uniref:hypothetical protein n=1 Tax=Paenibacillus sp. GSMTC-2017 TaxID=2794350 RepID=UPI0018D5B813|nr:hypothetical protein [Paenibacillus sp. GSMTC-2017]